MTGLCIDCREVWTADNIALLADHIRIENQDTEDTDSLIPEDDTPDEETAA